MADHCLQVMFRQDGSAITILDSNGIMYHEKEGSNFFINRENENKLKYKYIFPYSKIPYYKDKNCIYINQVLDFDKVYIQICNGLISEIYAIKDGKEALVANKFLIPEKEETKILTKDEVNEMYKKNKDSIYCLSGSKKNIEEDVVDEERIINNYRNLAKTYWDLEKEVLGYVAEGEGTYCNKSQEYGKIYHSKDSVDFVNKIFNKALDKLTIDDMSFAAKITENDVFVYFGKNGIESIKNINVKCLGHDKYQVDVYNYPLTKYTLDHLKQLETTNLVKTKEPRISRSLNPNIDMAEIKKSKEWVKKLKRR